MTTAVIPIEKQTQLLLMPPAQPVTPVIPLHVVKVWKPEPLSIKMPPPPEGCFKGRDNDCL